MNFLGFGSGPSSGSTQAQIILADPDSTRKFFTIKQDDKQLGARESTKSLPIYFDGESVSGKVQVRLREGKKVEHQGIKIELLGQIQLFYDRGNHSEFLSLSKELCAPGELKTSTSFDFEFKNVEKQFESYNGINVKLRYIVRLTILRRLSSIIEELDLWVLSYRQAPEITKIIRMEVGIEECLHIEFEYNKNKYHLKDVIVGKIYFLLVRIKIKNMELSIIRRETTGAGTSQYNESETVVKFEIMDGAPVKGETIPIRLFFSGLDLTPTYADVNKKFSTRYYLNLVLIDEENRRYFKQQEIIIYRIADDSEEYKKISGSTIPGLAKYISNENIEPPNNNGDLENIQSLENAS